MRDLSSSLSLSLDVCMGDHITLTHSQVLIAIVKVGDLYKKTKEKRGKEREGEEGEKGV